MVINKTCRTCEFNFDNICAGDGNYKYGEMIANPDVECEGWGISLDYFSQIINEMPWYIKQPYDSGKLYFGEALQKIEEDETEKGTKINIYDAIEHVYGIPWWELSEILGVKWSVVSRAVCRGPVEKRKKQFAPILCIPEGYFDEFYSKQLVDLEKCREKFYLLHGEEWVMRMREKAHDNLKNSVCN